MDVVKVWARKACDSRHVHMINAQVLKSQNWASEHPRNTLYGSLSILALLWFLAKIAQRLRKTERPSRPGTPDLEKIKPVFSEGCKKNKFVCENPGGNSPHFRFFLPWTDRKTEWTPSTFVRPAASPYPEWSLETTKPLAYRPFRPKYYVTMGLRSMPWDSWIELDCEYPKFHALKAERISSRGEKCCRTAPEAFDGALELVEEFCDYLPQRYPKLYKKTAVGMDNIVTGEKFNIVERPLKEDPMAMAARMVQDDLALMFEGKDGQYYFKAGAILLAGFWRLEDKFGMPLSEIHTSGDVPLFKEKLEKGMLNFFRRLKPDAPMCRNNYFIQVDDQLAWSDSIGSEDEKGISWNTAQKNKAIEHHHFRSERQSLRR